MISSLLTAVKEKPGKGIFPQALILAHIVLGSVLVYASPRSNLAFLLLLSSFFTLYYFKASRQFKTIVGGILVLVIFPVVGVRNIFYLEVIF